MKQRNRNARECGYLSVERNFRSGSFAANNIVALDDSGDANRLRRVFFLFIHANHASVGAHKHFGSAGNFRRQGEREVDFSAGSKVFLHGEVNAARRDIPSLAVVRTRFPIDRQADVYR